jgi:preprotein translocase subunit SecF
MNILKYTKIYLLISLLVLIPGVISLFVFGLNLSIDFRGGSIMEYEFEGRIDDASAITEGFREVFAEMEIDLFNVNVEGGNRVIARTRPVDVHENEVLKESVTEVFSGARQVSFTTIGPSVGAETTRRAFFALALATVGILLYIAYSFRNIPKPYSSFRFGSAAIVAMMHDAFLVLGIFSILGYLMGVEIDALFITAILTVIGFSVHDSIVVFDRVRENLKKLPHNWSFREIVNYSLGETLNRSLSTSLTVIITLFALFLLGGTTIKYFSLALLIGIVSGTYSSIFTASPVLVLWEEFNIKRRQKKKK